MLFSIKIRVRQSLTQQEICNSKIKICTLFTKHTKPTWLNVLNYPPLKTKESTHTHTALFKSKWDLILQTRWWVTTVCWRKPRSTFHSQVFQVFHRCFHVNNLSISGDEVAPSCHQRSLAHPSLENREQGMCLGYRTKEFFLSLAFTAGENGSWCAELHDKCAPSRSLLPL